jgi:undecaprenyl diphosphate synthase
VVLGPANCLPRSLVWELAYSEIVFVERSWNTLSVDFIELAIQEYFQRHRRFGGVMT